MDKRRELYAYTREQAMLARDRLAVELAHLQHVLKPWVKADLFGLLEYLRPEPDPRPDDMAELARMVAKELRTKGLRARLWCDTNIALPGFHEPSGHDTSTYWLMWSIYNDRFNNLNPRAIADAIQAEEAKKAAEWAGDE